VAAATRKHLAAYRREANWWLVEIRRKEPRQLFHHLEPAPYREKDLDPAAAGYLEDAATETGPGHPIKLRVHLPAAESAAADAYSLPEATGAYRILAEGLLIIGWVGLWRPVEIFLYDWWPLWRSRRRLEALSRMPVEIATSEPRRRSTTACGRHFSTGAAHGAACSNAARARRMSINGASRRAGPGISRSASTSRVHCRTPIPLPRPSRPGCAGGCPDAGVVSCTGSNASMRVM